MPELPEVETYIRELEPLLQARQVTKASVYWERIIAAPELPAFIHGIAGQRFAHFTRRGKYMLLGLESGDTLIVHLRMTGKLRLKAADFEKDKHTHLILDLDNGERLHYWDQRKFGRIWLVNDAEPVLRKLGPEPLSDDFSPKGFAGSLNKRKATIKALLLDQSIVAGVGNIYADEALFLAQIHPRRSGQSLTFTEIERLHLAIRSVLEQGILLGGSSLGGHEQNYAPPSGVQGSFQKVHQVFRKTGQPCPACGHPIERTVLAQRSTHFCPQCQPSFS